MRFVGVGGARMAAEGVQSPFDISQLSILGLLEGLLAYRRVMARVEDTVALAACEKPDVVVLIDSWLSEKSYVQTSSLVTLRNGNELSLDFSVVENEGAKVLAVASLIGGVDMVDPTIKVINPVTSEESELPFVEVFKESELH